MSPKSRSKLYKDLEQSEDNVVEQGSGGPAPRSQRFKDTFEAFHNTMKFDMFKSLLKKVGNLNIFSCQQRLIMLITYEANSEHLKWKINFLFDLQQCHTKFLDA